MERFQNILVGVDLADSDRIVSCELSPTSRAAVDRGIWLAKQTGARLTFLSALMPCLDLGPDMLDRTLQPHLTDVIDSLKHEAQGVMGGLVQEARDAGIEAEESHHCGTGWLELIRQVVQRDHDLVIIGSHKRHALGRLVLGSTGTKLLRKCPCPVWVVSAHESGAIRSILAPTDFSETCDMAVDLAVTLGEMLSARLHILHAVEYPHAMAYKVANIPAEYLNDYRFQVYREAKRNFDDMLARAGLEHRVDENARHLVSGHPAESILETVEREKIDLVVMGTAARSGLMGLLTGNTAEKVLPSLTCSVLAIKPRGFVCPIQFAEQPEPVHAT